MTTLLYGPYWALLRLITIDSKIQTIGFIVIVCCRFAVGRQCPPISEASSGCDRQLSVVWVLNELRWWSGIYAQSKKEWSVPVSNHNDTVCAHGTTLVAVDGEQDECSMQFDEEPTKHRNPCTTFVVISYTWCCMQCQTTIKVHPLWGNGINLLFQKLICWVGIEFQGKYGKFCHETSLLNHHHTFGETLCVGVIMIFGEGNQWTDGRNERKSNTVCAWYLGSVKQSKWWIDGDPFFICVAECDEVEYGNTDIRVATQQCLESRRVRRKVVFCNQSF